MFNDTGGDTMRSIASVMRCMFWNWILTAVVILILPSWTGAFYSGGHVNDALDYSGLQVLYKSTRGGQKPWKVSGYIVNLKSVPVDFSCRLFFNSYLDHRTAFAKIRIEVPADGKSYFNETVKRIGEEEFSDSKIEWDVVEKKGKNKKTAQGDVIRPEGSGPAVMTQIRNGYRFEGQGNQLTERFFLEAGVLKASVFYQGEKRIRATILNEDGGRGKSIVNDTGISESATGVSLRKPGYHYLSVRSSGKWRIELEMAGMANRGEGSLAGAYPVGAGSFNYEVLMDNGQVIPVDSFIDNGGTVTISRFGSQTTLKKSAIRKIVRK
jgi:hypothetical protein